jgi:hypothetical protein
MAESGAERTDRLEKEEKRLVVLKWTETLRTLQALRDSPITHATRNYIERWITEYEVAIQRVLEELIELEANPRADS